jgi:hypothetical protein
MSTLTQDTPVEETPAPAKQSISTKLFFLVVGVIAFIILTNVVRFPSLYLAYTFTGKVTSVSQKQVCIQPNNGEWSVIAQVLFQTSGQVCGELAISNFHEGPVFSPQIDLPNPFPSPKPTPIPNPLLQTLPLLQNKQVRAALTWQTNANGDWVKTYLFIQ